MTLTISSLVAELSWFCSSVQDDEYDFQPESNETLNLCPTTMTVSVKQYFKQFYHCGLQEADYHTT